MSRWYPLLAAGLAAVLTLTACATSPLGHRQLRLLPESQLEEMGAVAYKQIREDSRVVRARGVNRYVQCITRHVTKAAPAKRDWQVTVFADDTANAFALPGGRIGVNQGMLRLAENQDQLAAVIAHEVAHVVADHPNARLSAAFAAQTAQDLATALSGGGETSRQIMGLLGVGVQYGVLMPYGRTQESEADLLGLEYMARAGFDPRAGVELWRNMQQATGGGPPAFLSTHPSHGSRIDELSARMSQALETYRSARGSGRKPRCG